MLRYGGKEVKKNKILKMVAVLITLSVLILIIAEICYSKVPVFEVRQDETKIVVARGSYCWGSLLSGKCVDTIGPRELLKDIQPAIVESEDHFLFKFSKRPNEVDVDIYEGGQKLNYDINKGLLIGPKEKGIYIIDVTVRWDRGDSSFVFKIEVK